MYDITRHDAAFEERAEECIMLRVNSGEQEKFAFEQHQFAILSEISDVEFRVKLIQRYREMFAIAMRTLFDKYPRQNSTLSDADVTNRVDVIAGVLQKILEGDHVYNGYLDSEEVVNTSGLTGHTPKAFAMFTFEIMVPDDTDLSISLETADDLYVYDIELGNYKKLVA